MVTLLEMGRSAWSESAGESLQLAPGFHLEAADHQVLAAHDDGQRQRLDVVRVLRRGALQLADLLLRELRLVGGLLNRSTP